MFKEVTRSQNRLRLALDGPAGSGKTYTALRFAFALAGPGGRVAVIDTEHGSAAKYAGEAPDGTVWKWSGVNLLSFAPSTYEQVIDEAGRQGFDVLVIDSLSHAWTGVGGALDQVDRSDERNKFAAWRNVTPQHARLVEAILRSPCHVIATLRTKTEWVLEADEKGKMVPKKIGTKPVQRDGIEYEFDIVCDLDVDHRLVVSKSRCPAVDGKIVMKPDAGFLVLVREWLFSGSPPPPPPPEGPAPAAAPVEPPPAGPTLRMKAKPTAMAEAHHVERIKALWVSMQRDPADLKRILEAKGYHRLADLPRAEAESLIRILEIKETEFQAKEAF